MRPPLPYEFMPPVPSFGLESDDIREGELIGHEHVYDKFGLTGKDRSPHLRWYGFPPQTRGFAVTCLDVDVLTGSGFWHWVLFDIPASVTELPRGAGSGSMKGLPTGAVHARNDTGAPGYLGPAPPPGHGDHRYVFAVHALDLENLEVTPEVAPAIVGFNLTFHTLARAVMVPIYGR